MNMWDDAPKDWEAEFDSDEFEESLFDDDDEEEEFLADYGQDFNAEDEEHRYDAAYEDFDFDGFAEEVRDEYSESNASSDKDGIGVRRRQRQFGWRPRWWSW